MNAHSAFASGNVAVITGAADGIGLAAAKKFASLGMRVCMADVDIEKLEQAAGEVIIADDERIAMCGGQAFQKSELRVIRILVLVHEDVFELPAVALSHILVADEQTYDLRDQVVEIQSSGRAQALLVHPVAIRDLVLVRCNSGPSHLFGTDQGVLRI